MPEYPVAVVAWDCPGCHEPYRDPVDARSCCLPQEVVAWECGAPGCSGKEPHRTKALAATCPLLPWEHVPVPDWSRPVQLFVCPSCDRPYGVEAAALECCPAEMKMFWKCFVEGCPARSAHETEEEARECFAAHHAGEQG